MPLPDDIVMPQPVAPKSKGPLWKGPEEDGISFSLLSRFLVCRERFRVHAMDGLQAGDGWNHKLGYGEMWHVCEEALSKILPEEMDEQGLAIEDVVYPKLMEHAREQCAKFKTQQEEIDKWYNVCKMQFPEYVRHWQAHPDVTDRIPIEQEKIFTIPLKLPSGRWVKLRGKRDAVDFIGNGNGEYGVYLQENKTKGNPKPVQLQRQLTFDLQTMMYLVALYNQPSCDLGRDGYYRHEDGQEYPILGVRYNVIRRPLSGGKGTIVQHKPSKSNPQGESKEAYYARLRQYIVDEPENYFMRWKVEVSPEEVEIFRKTCLDPILETLCIWYDLQLGKPISVGPWSLQKMMHWRHPFGVWNPLDEGGATDLDEYLMTGSTVGLSRVDDLFPELNETPF